MQFIQTQIASDKGLKGNFWVKLFYFALAARQIPRELCWKFAAQNPEWKHSRLDKQYKNAGMTNLCLDHAVKPGTVFISLLNNIHSSALFVLLDSETQI